MSPVCAMIRQFPLRPFDGSGEGCNGLIELLQGERQLCNWSVERVRVETEVPDSGTKSGRPLPGRPTGCELKHKCDLPGLA